MDMQEIRDKILLATLPDIAFDGWTDHALRSGAQRAGYPASMIERAFPGGTAELIEHFNNWADRMMAAELRRRDLGPLRVGEKISLAVRIRLDLLAPYREAIRRSVAFLSLPANTVVGMRLLYRTVDTVWHAVGDTSTDFNFYTKRALLAGVVSATVLYWINDTSDDFQDTYAFMDRRLQTVTGVGKAVAKLGQIDQLMQVIPSPFRFARQFRRRASGV